MAFTEAQEQELLALVGTVKKMTDSFEATVSNLQTKHGEWGAEVGAARKDFKDSLAKVVSPEQAEEIAKKVLANLSDASNTLENKANDGGQGQNQRPSSDSEKTLSEVWSEMTKKQREAVDKKLESLKPEERSVIENDKDALKEFFQGAAAAVQEPGNSLFQRLKNEGGRRKTTTDSEAVIAAKAAWQNHDRGPDARKGTGAYVASHKPTQAGPIGSLPPSRKPPNV